MLFTVRILQNNTYSKCTACEKRVNPSVRALGTYSYQSCSDGHLHGYEMTSELIRYNDRVYGEYFWRGKKGHCLCLVSIQLHRWNARGNLRKSQSRYLLSFTRFEQGKWPQSLQRPTILCHLTETGAVNQSDPELCSK
jgi:hypothetical protein